MNILENIIKADEISLVPYDEYKPYPKISDRNFWDGLNGELKADLIKKGAEHLNFVWEGVPATSYLEYYKSGDRKCNESVMFKKRRALGSLVIAECAENKGRFTDDIINGIWSICEETSWAVSAHVMNTGKQEMFLPDCVNDAVLDLFALETAQLMAFANYMLKDDFDKITTVISERIASELERRVFTPYINRNDYWWMGFSGTFVNNWSPWCTSNVLISAMLTCKDDEKRAFIINKAVKTLDIFLNSYPEDGSCDEGTSYWFKAGGALIDALDAIMGAVKTDNNPFEQKLIKNIAEFIIKARIDKQYYINFADGSAIIKNSEPALLFHMGNLLCNDSFKKEGAYLSKLTGEIITYAEWYSPHKVMLGIKYYDKIKKYDQQPICEKDTWWSGIQVMLARECGNYGKGFVLAAKGGHNDESHNHNDVGNVIVYSDGKPILIDAGVGVYTKMTFSDRRYEIWTMRSCYHNLPIIDGFEQNAGKEFASCDTEYESNESFSMLKLNLKNAYPKEAGVEKWIRTSKLDKENGEVSISEEFELDDMKKVRLVFMCAYKPVISNDLIQIENCVLKVKTQKEISLSCEEIEITDEKLAMVWGKSLYRVFVDLSEKTDSASIEFAITKK